MDGSQIKPGMTLEASEVVSSERSASSMGSGALSVYATPAMAAFIENICCRMVDPLIPEDKTTVGVEISMQHMAPTPLGMNVHARVEIVSIEGSLITFQAHLRDDFEPIGTAEHQRAIVDVDRFLKRVEAKSRS